MKTAILIHCYNEAKIIEKIMMDFEQVLPHSDIFVLFPKFINIFFKSDLNDIMAEIRSFSHNFVKSIIISSEEFEIKTEMNVFTLINTFKIKEHRNNLKHSLIPLNDIYGV